MTDPNGLAPLQQFALNDRLANYGDGVFTTMSVKDGKVALLNRHIARLVNDGAALGLSVAENAVRQVIQSALKQRQDGVLKLLIGAGQGGRGYARPEQSALTVAVSWHEIPAFYQQWQQQGIHLGSVGVNLARQPLLAGLKHANRLEQVLIKRALANSPYDDAIVTDENSTVIEASAANLFWLKEGHWYTAGLEHAGVNGVMRQFILAQSVPVQEVAMSLSEVADADAMFLSNALMQVVPVQRLTIGAASRELAVAPVLSLWDTLKPLYAGEYGAA
ncbi:aminodeoxychorismate lyase [Alteromonas lipolytica]|uniref:Aminodeoxychorismate lyase n=1 Tax=Alteromonas lipolytica TaxID=1856405 RepID=A0A1E8FK54_9ALTE|nr:aminodeoxychorismate lyase [Alteromonas lipolytica]OFI35813.1 aminodeoxychorismate lyase [Alteromonas lipolytica]GGF81030.1 aminodeoxychorismate lyase [Alteromonas lipolytica]